MKRHLFNILLSAAFSLTAISLSAQQLAFPGAQGWGRFAVGGRNGSVYHVTTLNDSGAGSLRDAISQPNRIIVFDVAGVINLKSALVFKNNLYVAGQTAPGEGITIYGNRVSFSGASNIIVRHMRFRMGHKGDSGKDCAGLANGANMIFDHCSFAWGLDETFSINPDGKGTTPQNITLQNCVVGQGLMTHSAGGLMQADYISLIGNFYCDNATRNNKIKGINQYANNIVYNWKNGAYIMGGDSEGSSYVNIQSNLFINGPAVGGAAFTGGNADFHCYGVDNWQDNNRDGAFDPFEITDYNAATRVNTPYDYPELELNPGRTLLETNLPTVGASLPYRDMTDCYMVDEVMSYGKKGALISNEEGLIYGAPSTWNVWKGEARQDTDGDGMPDAWEEANGTNPAVNDAMTKAANGYTNIENYINSITVDDRQFFLRAPIGLELDKASTTTLRITWRDYTYDEQGFIIEMKKDGVFTEVARTPANTSSHTLAQLEQGTQYELRVRAYKGDKYSDYSQVLSTATRPVEVGVIDVDNYEADLTWGGSENATWDLESNNWNNGTTVFENNKNTLIDTDNDATIQLNTSVEPASLVVKGLGHVTITGSGAIGGQASVNKAGEGVLTLNTTNTYNGPTVVHDGVLEFNSLKDGGVASAIGASASFAQNCNLNGGTLRYTGGNTSTNREMRLSQTSAFDVKTATVTMTGKVEGTDANANFVKDGDGQITVATTGFFAYPGATVLRGGTLYLSTVDIAKAGIGSSSKLILEGGHLKTKGESNNYETYSFPIEVVEGTTSQFSPNRNCYINNAVSGAGTIQLNIPYLREYVQGDWSQFTGTLIANGISSESTSLLLLDKTPKLNNTIVNLKGNARICYWSTSGSQTIGGLSGDNTTYLSGSSKSTDNFTCTWTIGTANSDETFRGRINNWSASGSGHSGTTNIIKDGTGLWRLTNTNDYKGTTTIKGGTLIVNGTNSGAGAVAVQNEAMLKGTGTIAGKVTAQKGATIEAGDTLVNNSVLKLNGGLTMLAGSELVVPVTGMGILLKTNTVKVKGALAVNDATLNVDLTRAPALPNGTAIKVFDLSDATVSGNGFTTIVPERPSENQKWDTWNLLRTGIIYIRDKDDVAVSELEMTPEQQPVYNIKGQKVSPDTKGLIIRNGKKINR